MSRRPNINSAIVERGKAVLSMKAGTVNRVATTLMTWKTTSVPPEVWSECLTRPRLFQRVEISNDIGQVLRMQLLAEIGRHLRWIVKTGHHVCVRFDDGFQ